MVGFFTQLTDFDISATNHELLNISNFLHSVKAFFYVFDGQNLNVSAYTAHTAKWGGGSIWGDGSTHFQNLATK